MDDIKLRKSGAGHNPKFFVPPREAVPASRPRPLPVPKPLSPKVSDKERFKPKIPPPPQSRQVSGFWSRKRVIIVVIILLIVAGIGGYFGILRPRLNSKPSTPAVVNQQPRPEPSSQPELLTGNFRIVATGDIITHDSVNQNARQPDGSYKYDDMFSEIKPVFAKSKTRICHNTVPTGGASLGISGYPNFNAPAELIDGLALSGCNIMSLASDHINDKGQAGIDATRVAIEKQKTITVTAGANRSLEEQNIENTFNIGEGALKFGYLSYTTRQANGTAASFAVNVYNKDIVRQQITTMKTKADFVIVSMCWGREDSGDIIAEQDLIAQELADAGADIVLGHCTHVVQPVKRLPSGNGKETVVYYSLGNALNSQLPLETLIGGLGVIDIDIATKKITSVGMLPTYMHYEWTAAQKAAKALTGRTNLKLYPLDQAAVPLAASQNGTTVEAQTRRIKEITNRFTLTKILTTADFQ